MNEINRVVRKAAWRVGVANFLYGTVLCLTAAIIVALLLRTGQQVAGLGVRWEQVVYGMIGVCFVGGIAWAILARPSKLDVARRVDEGANLKESLSTALCVAGRTDDPWAKATVETATRQARGVRMSHAVPISPPKFWPVPFALGLVLAIVFIALPKMDLFKWETTRVAKTEAAAQIVEAKAEALEVKEKIKEMTKNLDIAKKEPDAPEAHKPEPQTAEEVRKAAIKELSQTIDRLQEVKTGPQAQKLEAINKQMQQMKTAGEMTADLSKSLQAGDFSKAKAELQKMKDQAAGKDGGGAMSEKEKKQLAQQLDDIAKQLDKMAKNKEALEKQLEAAGLDKALAKDPSALEKALKDMPSLSAEQKQQMSQAAQASKQGSESMQGLSKAMQQMAEGMQQGDQQGMQEGSKGAEGQLSELEQIAQDMAEASAAQSECQSKMSEMGGKCNKPGQGEGQCNGDGSGNKPWSEGWSNRQGNGRGGGGLGQGGSASTEKADFSKEDRKNIGPQGQGPIVGSRLVEGDSIKGESRAEFSAAVAKGDQAATEAIENNTIPREYHEAIKSYFGRLKTKSIGGKDAKSKDIDTLPPEPAPSKDADKK